MQVKPQALLLRGRCEELSRKFIKTYPGWKLVRGYYVCPFWGKQEHWWCVKDGKIHDETKDQFPSQGKGEYLPFNGTIDCEHCGKPVAEEDAIPMGNYGCCSMDCARALVGV